MTVRPILFSAPMVRALLAGTKTQTRRAWRIQPPPGVHVGWVPGETKQPYGWPGGRLVAIVPSGAQNRDIALPGLQARWHGPFDNEFAGTSVSVAILEAGAV